MVKSKYTEVKSIPFKFNAKHVNYIRGCVGNTYNIAEGAVRAGKTIDNVYAFAHELKTCEDKIHLATGSTQANAKLNIGDANGFGLEYLFRGQCHWGKFKGNECLYIKGPKTNCKQKIVIFAGAALANSYKKIRGNSYGMWIATEVNLHHDNTIKEAFNRTLASRRRKVFWDLNPDHPKAPIYLEYIDKYIANAKSGKLLGGVNYQNFTIFDNISIPERDRNAFISQYEVGSVWYQRDILGIRSIAEGLIYRSIAAEYAATDKQNKKHFMSVDDARREMFQSITIGIDFGGTKSGHAFVASSITESYNLLIALASELHIERDKLDDDEIDPEGLGVLVVNFVRRVIKTFGFVTMIRPDSAEPVLIRGIKKALASAGLSNITVRPAEKHSINSRIFAFSSLATQNRFFYTEMCDTLLEALGTAVWNAKSIEKVRLDNGTSDIDTLDAFEYTFERDIKRLLPTFATAHTEKDTGTEADE